MQAKHWLSLPKLEEDLELEEETEPPGGESLFKHLENCQVIEVIPFVTTDGVGFSLNGVNLQLSYPQAIWDSYPKAYQQILSHNLAFSASFPLPYLLPKVKSLIYNMPIPIAESFLFKGLSLSLPSMALLNHNGQHSTIKLLRQLFNINYTFTSVKPIFTEVRSNSDKKTIVIPFSFGKDSLLTLALCLELGLKPHLIYISEPTYQFEKILKEKLAKKFNQEFAIKVFFLDNPFGIFRQSNGYMGWELQLTQYSLLLLPFVYALKSGFIFFANEQSCNDTIIDKEGFRCNPVYEQSHAWLSSNSVLASLVGGINLSIGSIIEPLYEIAIIKILHHRYPRLAKYQMSCDPQDKDKNRLKDYRWCENCSKCARIFIFLLANGIEPKKVAFKNWLLKEKYASLYPIFDINSKKSYGYDQSGAGKDEQLLAFHLAAKQGIKGALIDKFKLLYGEDTAKRERALRKKFFGIHSTSTVPVLYRKQLLSIFREELDNLAK